MLIWAEIYKMMKNEKYQILKILTKIAKMAKIGHFGTFWKFCKKSKKSKIFEKWKMSENSFKMSLCNIKKMDFLLLALNLFAVFSAL